MPVELACCVPCTTFSLCTFRAAPTCALLRIEPEGTVKRMVTPVASLAALVWPPCASTRCLTMINPKPVPPVVRCRAGLYSCRLARGNCLDAGPVPQARMMLPNGFYEGRNFVVASAS